MDMHEIQLDELRKQHAEDRQMWIVDTNLRVGMALALGLLLGAFLGILLTS